MITDITSENLSSIKNPQLRSYAAIYTRIYDSFLAQVAQLGIEIAPQSDAAEARDKAEGLREAGATVRNAGKSIYLSWLSPACEACREGIGSATFFVSLQCHRDCFYCFNPNQEDYTYYSANTRDLASELATIDASGLELDHLALTGGEPLLHKAETLAFFQQAEDRFPAAYKRLYTCGDHLDEDTLHALQQTGLDEIRFSLRMHDSAAARRRTLDNIAMAKRFVPRVMVEMPVLPGTQEEMRALLLELDRMEIAGINLLEFCFPLRNADTFRRRGYRVKREPFHVLYNYWYAGGLPVAGSELECLDLLDFAVSQRLRLGVHYCSLENKHSGQIYQQNTTGDLPAPGYFSTKDFFIKSAKVFGKDISKVERVFQKMGYRGAVRHPEHDCLEFHVAKIEALRRLDIEVAISWNVIEMRDNEPYVRELKVSLTHPKSFDMASDV